MGRVHPCQLDGWSIISESLQLKHPTRPKQIHSSSSLSAKRQTIISQESRLYLVSRPNLVSRPVQFGLIKSTVFCSFPLYFTNRSCYICHIRLLYSTASLQTISEYPTLFYRIDHLLQAISECIPPQRQQYSTEFYFTLKARQSQKFYCILFYNSTFQSNRLYPIPLCSILHSIEIAFDNSVPFYCIL